jgi:hypothetical protein
MKCICILSSQSNTFCSVLSWYSLRNFIYDKCHIHIEKYRNNFIYDKCIIQSEDVVLNPQAFISRTVIMDTSMCPKKHYISFLQDELEHWCCSCKSSRLISLWLYQCQPGLQAQEWTTCYHRWETTDYTEWYLFSPPDTPLRLADLYDKKGVCTLYFPTMPIDGPAVINATHRDFLENVFQNDTKVQTYHIDGYAFWVVGWVDIPIVISPFLRTNKLPVYWIISLLPTE